MRLSNTFPLAPEDVRRHRVGNALVKSRQKAQTVAPPKGRRGRPSPAEPGECCELFAAQTGVAFLDANPKGARQVRGPRSELRLRLPKSPPRVASSGIRDGLHRLACSKSLRSRLPRCDQPWERASAGAPRGLAHWAAEVESAPGAATEEAENAEIARLADGGRQIRLYRQRDTGALRGYRRRSRSTARAQHNAGEAWGGLNERRRNVRGIGVPAGRSPCSRTLQ